MIEPKYKGRYCELDCWHLDESSIADQVSKCTKYKEHIMMTGVPAKPARCEGCMKAFERAPKGKKHPVQVGDIVRNKQTQKKEIVSYVDDDHYCLDGYGGNLFYKDGYELYRSRDVLAFMEVSRLQEEMAELKEKWTNVPDEYENWEDFGQMLLDENDEFTLGIERIRKERDEARRKICEELAPGKDLYDWEYAKQRDWNCYDD